MPEGELLKAIHDLTDNVKILQRTLIEEYPKRAEVERRFVTERQSRQRRNQTIVLLLACIFISYFVTITSVSYCFLGGADDSKEPAACNVFPGYHEAQVHNKLLLKQFKDFLKITSENQDRIAKLEEQVNK